MGTSALQYPDSPSAIVRDTPVRRSVTPRTVARRETDILLTHRPTSSGRLVGGGVEEGRPERQRTRKGTVPSGRGVPVPYDQENTPTVYSTHGSLQGPDTCETKTGKLEGGLTSNLFSLPLSDWTGRERRSRSLTHRERGITTCLRFGSGDVGFWSRWYRFYYPRFT